MLIDDGVCAWCVNGVCMVCACERRKRMFLDEGGGGVVQVCMVCVCISLTVCK